jgi:hypothetical protein
MGRQNSPRSSFHGFCPPPAIEGWFPRSIYRGGFRGVALIGEILWIMLTPLWSKWLSTGFTLLVLTPVLSHLFTHAVAFEFHVGDLRNIWLVDSVARGI